MDFVLVAVRNAYGNNFDTMKQSTSRRHTSDVSNDKLLSLKGLSRGHKEYINKLSENVDSQH